MIRAGEDAPGNSPSAELPRWLGWTAIAIGMLFVTPAEVVDAAGLLIWTLIVSVLIYRAGTAQERSEV